MREMYLYCNSNQVYHALLHNSIYANSLVKSGFAAQTLSFLSDHFIFISKYDVSCDERAMGTNEYYYPVTIVLSKALSQIKTKAIPVMKNGENIALSGSFRNIDEIIEDPNCIGAFVYGEIPISLISRLVFDDEEGEKRFMRSSPDLWYPEDLFTIRKELLSDEKLLLKSIGEISLLADDIMLEEEYDGLNRLIIYRDKEKAAGYYLINATENWMLQGCRANFDGYLLSYLGDDVVRAEAERLLKEAIDAMDDRFILTKDPVLEADGGYECCLYESIQKSLLGMSDETRIDISGFEKIIRNCIENLEQNEICEDELNRFLVSAKIVEGYVYTKNELDPDKVLEKLGESHVLKALMFFLDQQDNAGFLNNVCKKLNYYERRYTFIMYGLFHGTAEVDGDQKKNRLLERLLEDKCTKAYSNEYLISDIPREGELEFCNAESGDGLLVFEPRVNKWYNSQQAFELIKGNGDPVVLNELMKRIDDPSMPEEKIYTLNEPVTVTVTCGEKEIKFELTSKNAVKGFIRDIEKSVKKNMKSGEKFNADAFLDYLSGQEVWNRFFEKNTDFVQEVCGKIRK